MIPSLPPNIQSELNQLAFTYSQPLVRVVELSAPALFDPLNKRDRYGEVCMVIRRPHGRLLTMKKTIYPPEGYRLPTGGINHNESIYHALLREIHEETGLEVKVQRFLAAVSYRVPAVSAAPVFYTFAFLLDELSGTLGALDAAEQVEDFREIEINQLLDVARTLESLKGQYSKQIDGDWGDWGQFRAAIHRVVWEALQTSA